MLYDQKEKGPGWFKLRPYKRRRRALESHSTEVFNLSEISLIDFNFFPFFYFFTFLIIAHGQSASEAAMGREIRHVLLGFFLPCGKSCKNIITIQVNRLKVEGGRLLGTELRHSIVAR